MTAPALDLERVRRIVRAALEEDLDGKSDVTTEAVVPAGSRARGFIVAREDLVVAGLPVASEVFLQLDPRASFEAHLGEGSLARAGDRLATVTGAARAILTGERTALNFLLRMCGIASAAHAAVEEVSGTGAVVLDTRKTAPGLRCLDKYAVAAGGAQNHRMGLHDALMIKDTHRAVAGSIEESLLRVRALGLDPELVTVEVENEDDMERAIRSGAGRVLLDNMDPASLARCVERARGRAVLEASGGLRPGRLRQVAETGVSFLSLGWLTHSVPAADLALEVEALP